jgi:hypothetical protein
MSTLEHWRARAEKLERERDALRHQLQVIAQEGANQRGPGRQIGKQCAQTKIWDTLPAEEHLRSAQEGEARAWWTLGFAEAVKWECYAHFGYDPYALSPGSEVGGQVDNPICPDRPGVVPDPPRPERWSPCLEPCCAELYRLPPQEDGAE